MISGKRKTIGVFICKAYSLFDNAVYYALKEQAKKLDYDVIVFTTVGYFASQNDYRRTTSWRLPSSVQHACCGLRL